MKLLQNLHNCDLYTFDWCLRRRHLQQLTRASREVSRTADGHLYAIALLLLLLFKQYQWAWVVLAAFAIERTCYFFMKSHFRRNRPPAAIPGFTSIVQPSDQFSFPSGHTSAAFLCTALAVAAIPALGWLLYPWAVAVGISRVLLGVHFPTDTLAGAALGHSVASLVLLYMGVA